MKAIVGGIEVDGTSDEILALIRGYQGEAVVKPTPSPSNPIVTSGQPLDDLAFRAIKRRPLSIEQSKLLSILRENHPKWTTAKDLQKALRFSPSQLGGLFGAFGKRLSSTEGYQVGVRLFDQEWDYDVDCYRYKLTDVTLTAVRRAGI